MRASDAAILAAITEWRGEVTHAASDLGIGRRTMYDRLDMLGVGPDELERLRLAGGALAVVLSDGIAALISVRSVRSVRTQGSVPCVGVTAEIGVAKVPSVEAAAKDEPQPFPVASVRIRSRQPKLRPPNMDRFVGGVIDLVAKFRRQFSEDDVFNQFFQETWERWIQEKTGATDQPEPKRKSARVKGGAE